MTDEEKRVQKQLRRKLGNERTKHHRRPVSAGGTNEWDNISPVRKKFHDAFHLLFGPGLPEVVAETLNEIYLDPEYELVVRKRKVPLKRPRPRGGSLARRYGK